MTWHRRCEKKSLHILAVAVLLGLACPGQEAAMAAEPRQVTAPPESLKVRSFYKKYLDCGGLPIVSSEKVADAALIEAARLVDNMLAGRPDVRKAMVEKSGRVMIVGAEEGITDLPEYGWMKPKEFWNKRSRGFGGGHGKLRTSVGEENLLGLPVDIFEEENILIHEFAHTIHETLNLVDENKEFDKKLKALHEKAVKKGLWRCPYKEMYAVVNYREYWAEGVQSFFDCNNQNNFKHNHVNTREELTAYDPDLARLIEETFRLTAQTDWRYEPPVKRPQVTPPAKSLRCDPYYRKQVWARGLPILGSEKVSDAALLGANHIARQMFAYRHDIFSAMTDAGLRVVVVGEKEKFTDIRGPKTAANRPRVLFCAPERKLIACGEENLLCGDEDPHAGESVLVGELARALHALTGHRPVDEELQKKLEAYGSVDRKRRSSVRILRCQIGVKPIDERFDQRLKQLHRSAVKKGFWKDTRALKGPEEYWVEGVQSWFDANRQDCDGHNHVNTREELQQYDPDLAALIAEVFRHADRVDWRYRAPSARNGAGSRGND